MRTAIVFGVFTAAAAVSTLAVFNGCASTSCEDYNGCGSPDGASSGDVTPAEGGADVVVPPGCELTKEPKDSAACVDDGVGVFVDAASGLDTNAGTKTSPVKTLAAALSKRAGKPRVYVCDGTYPERVTLTDAVGLYGGFACGSWTYTGAKPKVAPNDAGYALHIDNASANAVTVADLAFAASAGTQAAPSSIAAFVRGSQKVTLLRVALDAKAGAPGKNETKAADGALMTSTPTAGSLDGNAGNATIGGLAQLCTCVGGATSKGGGGGNVNSGGESGETAQATPDPPAATGLGNTFAECNGGTFPGGRAGSNAPAALPAEGAKRLGELTPNGWVPEPGKNALRGGAGQGGGGGGGSGGGGGGGACGGCGGDGGKGGAGGGASIALLTLDSPVIVTGGAFSTGAAGQGGAGGQGGDGISGGTRGGGGGAACNGGNGGRGGNGGAGGGGAGGVSVGVLYKGPKPTVAASFATGAFGVAGSGPAGNDGIPGVKADTLESP